MRIAEPIHPAKIIAIGRFFAFSQSLEESRSPLLQVRSNNHGSALYAPQIAASARFGKREVRAAIAVAEALLPAIRDVIGEGATDEVLAAWGEAYWFLADILIGKEAVLYEEIAA